MSLIWLDGWLTLILTGFPGTFDEGCEDVTFWSGALLFFGGGGEMILYRFAACGLDPGNRGTVKSSSHSSLVVGILIFALND